MISPMSYRVATVLILLTAGAVLTAGEIPQSTRPAATAVRPIAPETQWQRAVDAWEAGKYPDALNDLRALMKSPAAPEYFERVALITGELFVTTVLTNDG